MCNSSARRSAAEVVGEFTHRGQPAMSSRPCRSRHTTNSWGYVESSTMAPLTMFRRADMLERLESESFDVLVIGGGVTGVGVALDAAARGLRTALVERDDFASGTSSKSSKLVHGGLRYLQDDPRLVYQALHERQRLRKNAPHLVKVLPFMIPILSKDGAVSRRIARAMGTAMWMYDITGGWRIGKFHRRLGADAAFAHMPTMQKERLASAYLYFDATVDDARLCLTLARTAAIHGAAVVNRCAVVELTKDASGKATGAVVDADGRLITVRATAIVNAAGVWSDEVRALDEGADPNSIRPAKGIHITLPWDKVRNDIAVVIPVPKDKRSLFVVPWGRRADGTFDYSYVGTTDTDYQGPIDDPQCTKDDISYILNALNASLTTGVTESDITGVWAGLRPLVKSAASGRTADLSRRHKVERSASSVITVTGGKLTTYREMAEDTVDEVCAVLGVTHKSVTKRLPLLGAVGYREPSVGSPAAHLADRFGVIADDVTALASSNSMWSEPLIPGLPYLKAEAIYAVRSEMAMSLDDVLTRRTRARLFDRTAAVAAAADVAKLIAPELGWDDAEVVRQIADFTDSCALEQTAAQTSDADLLGANP
jgi:glycerol-3-phosphate dehydrogenase